METNSNVTSQPDNSDLTDPKQSGQQVQTTESFQKLSKPKPKRSKTWYDIEDEILDSILKDKLIQGSTSITNPWLPDSLTGIPSLFTFKDTSLIAPPDSGWPKFQKLVLDNGDIQFNRAFECAFVHILSNKSTFFNQFHKFTSTSKPSVFEGVALFVVWLSKYLKPKITAFIFDFLAVLCYGAWKKSNDLTATERYFINNIIKQRNADDIVEAGESFYQVYGANRIAFLDFEVVVQYLADYFMGNDLLSLESN